MSIKQSGVYGDLDNGIVDSFDYYSLDISRIDMIDENDKNILLSEIIEIGNKLNELFLLVGCSDDIFGKNRKPWIGDKVEYCLNNCNDSDLLNRINTLYRNYIIKRNRYIEVNLKFVITVAKSYIKDYGSISFEDLVQYGNMGLIRAIEMFNPKYNVQFLTYAGYWINQSIIINSKNTMYPIRIPIYVFENNNLRLSAIDYLTQKMGMIPSEEQIAEYMGMSVAKVRDTANAFYDYVSIDEFVGVRNEELDVDDLRINIMCDDSVDVEEDVFNKLMREELNSCMLEYLNERERFVLRNKYGLDGYKTYPEMASVLNVSYQRVEQIKGEAFVKLLRRSKVRELKLYLG